MFRCGAPLLEANTAWKQNIPGGIALCLFGTGITIAVVNAVLGRRR